MIGINLPPERVVSSIVALIIACAVIPTLGWMARSSRHQQMLLAFVVVFLGMTMSAAAAWWDPPWWCNPDLLPYGICWPW